MTQAAKTLRGKGDVGLEVAGDKYWNYLLLRTDAGGEIKMPEIPGNLDLMVKADKSAREWVAFEAGDMDRLATLFGFVSERVYPYNYAEFGMYNERFARLSAANYATQATMFLKDPKFAVETTVNIPLLAASKSLEGAGVISVGNRGVVLTSGPFTLIGPKQERVVHKEILFRDQRQGAVTVQYERKQLMDAIRGVQPLDKHNRIWLTAAKDGKNTVGSYDKSNWLSVNTLSHEGESSPKAISASYALKILARMEGKQVTLSWDHVNDHMDEKGKTLPGWSPVFFSSKEMRKWKIILAPIAQG